MSRALLCIDFINEIVHPDGKLAAKGYATFAEKHNTLANLASLQAQMRADGAAVVHVHLGFAEDYSDHPAGSPLLGGARANGLLRRGTWSTEILAPVAPKDGDHVLTKTRISAFHKTGLEELLNSLGVTELVIAGVATDIAVQSAARDGHDRDLAVTIASSCCAAAAESDHDEALRNLAKFATVA